MVNKKQIRKKFIFLVLLIFLSMTLYLYARLFAKALDSGIPLTFPVAIRILKRSAASLLGMGISAALIAVVSLAFQTITENRVLTPSMLGFDSVFLATQSLLVYFAASVRFMAKMFSNPYCNFFCCRRYHAADIHAYVWNYAQKRQKSYCISAVVRTYSIQHRTEFYKLHRSPFGSAAVSAVKSSNNCLSY